MAAKAPLLHLAVAAAALFAAVTVAVGAPVAPPPALAVRLQHAFSVPALNDGQDGGGGLMECWGALEKLGSCTSEIVLFFVNGESYIGPECCRAIRGATRHCWPAMLASVGFTAEEADVLRGFCDAEAAGAGGAAQSSPPAPAPAGTAA